MAKTIQILLADDHQMMRQGLRLLLQNYREFAVIAEAENGRTAVQLAQQLRPDIAIMDITMPDLNGIDATRQILARAPGTKVVALSMHSDRQFVLEMLRAGASAYLLKDCAMEELSAALRSVARDETYVSPKISGHILAEFSASARRRRSPTASHLTDREREVLQLLAEGKGTKEIGVELSVSAKTVETHRHHIMGKLDLYTVAELTKYAIREGLTSLQ